MTADDNARRDSEEWQIVRTVQGLVLADIVKGKLAAEEIPAQFRYEAVGPIYGLTINGLGAVEILVPAALMQKAKQILAEIYREDEIPWQEP